MRLLSVAVALMFALVPTSLRASSLDNQIVNQQTIDALQAKINLAQPREQCYLYAQLVNQLAELSMRQYSAGETDKASRLLNQIGEFSAKIRLSFRQESSRLKNAEILLRHTSFRLNELLHNSSYEDRETVATALAQVTQVQKETMLKVFVK